MTGRAKMGLALAFGLTVFLAALAYVRLAPADPAVWHVDLAAEGFDPFGGQVFCITPDNRYGPLAEGALERLATIVQATPRTELVAGSPAEGHMTWVTRSALIGYPDYTTVQLLSGPTLCLFGRQRFGYDDWGVNAARIGGWMQTLLGLEEPPPMTGLPASP